MLYWRLSSFYFFFFATLGALLPYWGWYLQSLGYSSLQIGQMMAVIMATKIVSPNVWGWIADHTGRRMAVVRIGTLLAVFTFAGVFLAPGFGWLLLVMLAYSFFWNAALPQFEANTFNHLGRDAHRYSSIRLWGSVGFIVTVAGLGMLFDVTGPGLLPHAMLLLLAGIWLSSLSVPEQPGGHPVREHEPLGRVLARPAVVGLLLACFLMQASHGPYYTFFTIYMGEQGYSGTVTGQLWALGVIAEVGVFLVMHRLVPRFGLHRLLMASLALASLRWVMIGLFPGSLPLLVLAQTLHAASFGVYHAAAIQLIHNHFTGPNQGRGQALYSSLSFGAGGAVGGLYSGMAWDGLGSTATFLTAAAASTLALVIAWRFIPRRHMAGVPAG